MISIWRLLAYKYHINTLFQAYLLAVTAVQVTLAAPDHHHRHREPQDKFFLTNTANLIPDDNQYSYDSHQQQYTSSDYGTQESYGAPDYGTVEAAYDVQDYGTGSGETYGAPEYDPDLESFGSSLDADLKALGIVLPFLKFPLLKGLFKLPLFKPLLKIFKLKAAKLLFESLIKKPGGIQPDDPGLTPQSYESPHPGTGVIPNDESGLIPGKNWKAKLLFVVLGILLPLALIVMVLEMTFTLLMAANPNNLLNPIDQVGRRKREADSPPLLSPGRQPSNFEFIMKSIR